MRDHRPMRADMHLDPDGLRAAAALAATVVDLLHLPPDPGVADALRGLPEGSRLVAEHMRLLTAVDRARVELTSMEAAMRDVAAAAEAIDGDLARQLCRHAMENR